MIYEEIQKKLFETTIWAIKKQKISRSEICEKTGIKKTNLSVYLKGDVSLKKLSIIADAVGIDLDATSFRFKPDSKIMKKINSKKRR